MSRFKVVRGIIQHKRKRYKAGEFLPENFTMKDRMHNTFPHRIVEVSDEEAARELQSMQKPVTSVEPPKAKTEVKAAPSANVQVAAKATIQPQVTQKGNLQAAKNPASPHSISGTNVNPLQTR